MRCSIVAIFALAAVIAHAQDAIDADRRKALEEKARSIVEAYTPDKEIHVQSARAGLRPVGVRIEETTNVSQPPGVQSAISLPDWIDLDRLLGRVTGAVPFTVSVLWRVEPGYTEISEPLRFGLIINQHDGYGRRSESAGSTLIKPESNAVGAVFWSKHRFDEAGAMIPGLSDVILRGTETPAETIPLGQILVEGRATRNAKTADQCRAAIGSASLMFAGMAVLTTGDNYTFAANNQPTVSGITIISSVDWMEDIEDGATVAEVEVEFADGSTVKDALRLGSHTSSTWYELHARGDVAHSQAAIAWTWPIQQDAIQFDAAVYRAAIDTPEKTIKSVSIKHVHDRGILRVRGIALR